MGTFSIWHWLAVWGVVAMPLIAVLAERSDKTLPRLRYAIWVVAFVALMLVPLLIPPDTTFGSLFFALIVAWLVFTFLFYWASIRRLRDIGHAKWWVLLMMVAPINLALIVYLLARPGRLRVA